MATYGNFPGVQVTTAGGGITGIEVGDEEKVVIFGRGAPDAGNRTASYESPEQIGARREADTKFGEDSELATAMKDALANGANISYLYGVMPTESGAGDSIDTGADTPTEQVSGQSSGTLADFPIVEETGFYAVRDTVDAVDMTVNLVYESAPSAPADANTIAINPQTGEWAADSSSDYDFFYNYLDWSAAFNAADTVVNEDETGLYVALSEAETVASTLSGKTTSLRNEYQLVNGIAGAMPNQTNADDEPTFDTTNYTDGVDNDSQFLFAPVRLDNSRYTALGSIGGLFGGAAISEPVYNDTINTGGNSLTQKLTRSEAQDLRDEQVIPVREAGAIRVKGNLSTSTDQDWERDFWRRRIVDRVILIAKEVGDATIGRINDDQTRNAAERTIRTELQALANDRLIKANTADETNFFVDVYEDSTNSDEVNIDIGVTPQGIVKRVDTSVTINT
ncbi:tail sheath [Halogranum tailed virus 1]|uniref:Tail sheath n=1 Tax=Halogranum tailed virus 1 TaxID=1273749 RepID=R4TKZ7_9CAUD|nr:tail sheath [Halogranum tailed virus 1]AGM11347.1 tail sheath [Halogranum tailed virus 1]